MEYYSSKQSALLDKYRRYFISQRIISEVSERFDLYGILSLSESWSSTLMWSHYAGAHSGICLEFDIDVKSRPALKRMNYDASRAIRASSIYNWKLKKSLEGKNSIINTLFYSKSNEWSYEKEWRDISDESGEYDNGYILTSVYFGMSCEYSLIITIVRLLGNKNVNFYRVEPDSKGYNLNRRIFTEDELSEIEQIGAHDSSYHDFQNHVDEIN